VQECAEKKRRIFKLGVNEGLTEKNGEKDVSSRPQIKKKEQSPGETGALRLCMVEKPGEGGGAYKWRQGA